MFFEKVAKLHELMEKMDNRDFGLALRYVGLSYLNNNDCSCASTFRENKSEGQLSGSQARYVI